MLGQLDTHRQKKKIGPSPYFIYKNELKMHQRPKILNLLEENIGGNLHDI